MNRRNFNVLAAALAAFTAIPATAQSTWPNKPITLVVPYAPGGTADALARVLAQHLGTRLKVSVVVLNKAGASGVIGAASVSQAPADGYTVLYDATPLSINPHLQKLPFDAAKDLQPVALVGVTPMLVVVAVSSLCINPPSQHKPKEGDAANDANDQTDWDLVGKDDYPADYIADKYKERTRHRCPGERSAQIVTKDNRDYVGHDQPQKGNRTDCQHDDGSGQCHQRKTDIDHLVVVQPKIGGKIVSHSCQGEAVGK